MYERFYRLRERPFALTPDPDYLYPSRVHSEALSYLRYGIETHAGFVVITGAIGSGKTTLLQTLLRGLDSQTTVARVMNTLLDPRELLESAMIDLGLDPDGKSKPALLKAFGEFLVNERAAGRLVLLVIHEAQNLSLPALEEIRMLSNLETEKSKLLQIILIGQPELRELLARNELRQLAQRITGRYHLNPLSSEETTSYVRHRLRVAGATADIFNRFALEEIYRHSGGVPRVINVLCDRALESASTAQSTTIDAAAVVEAAREMKIAVPVLPRLRTRRYAMAAAALPLAVIAGGWALGAVRSPFSRRAQPPPLAARGEQSPASGGSAVAADAGRRQPPAPAASPQRETLTARDSFAVVAASFKTATRATAVAAQASALGLPAFTRSVGEWQQVQVGPYATREEADTARQQLDAAGLAGTRVILEPAER